MRQTVNQGDVIIIPEELNNGRKCTARVIAIYNRFILLEKENGIRMTLQYGDINKACGVIKGSSEETDEMEQDILANI